MELIVIDAFQTLAVTVNIEDLNLIKIDHD